MSKTLKLYGHETGPNPWKVAIFLEELGVPYEQEFLDFSVLKQEPFISANPNGRVPALEDPNTGVTLWESGAIIDYILDTYDKNNTFRYTQSPQKYLQVSWRDFQMSGQGPYFGQKAWFTLFHSEKIPSAVDRYGNEVKRIYGVIDAHLTKTGQPYLVGEKISYADLMFVPWNVLALQMIMGEGFEAEFKKDYPKAYEWHQSMAARPAVKKVFDFRAEKLAEQKQKK